MKRENRNKVETGIIAGAKRETDADSAETDLIYGVDG
jgi:hypothetical protein